MISKQDLIQYSDLKKEVVEVRNKIKKLEQDILKIESGETVIDSVTGGNGGYQHFKIEGVPIPEYSHRMK